MEDFFEEFQRRVGGAGAEACEKILHRGLPASINVFGLHAVDGFFEVGGFDVAHEQAIRFEKEGIIGPTVPAKRGQHFRPDVSMGGLVLGEAIGFDPKQKTDALHGVDGSNRAGHFKSR